MELILFLIAIALLNSLIILGYIKLHSRIDTSEFEIKEYITYLYNKTNMNIDDVDKETQEIKTRLTWSKNREKDMKKDLEKSIKLGQTILRRVK